jgi:tyrosinase
LISEPIFFLHHAFIDKMYWDWQQINPDVRLTEIGGVRIPFHPESANVTLNDTLNMQWAFDTTPISEVMHIQKGVLCYLYE